MAELAHHPGGLVRVRALIERVHPLRRRLAPRHDQGVLRCQQAPYGPIGLVPCGIPPGLDCVQVRQAVGVTGTGGQQVQARGGSTQGPVRIPGEMGDVAEAGKDVRGHLPVPGHPGQVQGAAEMLAGQVVVPGIVGHPPAHLRDGGTAGVGSPAGAGHHQARGNPVGKVGQDAGVQVSTAHPQVCFPPRRHRCLIRCRCVTGFGQGDQLGGDGDLAEAQPVRGQAEGVFQGGHHPGLRGDETGLPPADRGPVARVGGADLTAGFADSPRQVALAQASMVSRLHEGQVRRHEIHCTRATRHGAVCIIPGTCMVHYSVLRSR